MQYGFLGPIRIEGKSTRICRDRIHVLDVIRYGTEAYYQATTTLKAHHKVGIRPAGGSSNRKRDGASEYGSINATTARKWSQRVVSMGSTAKATEMPSLLLCSDSVA